MAHYDMSQLEREFELEMGTQTFSDTDPDTDQELEAELENMMNDEGFDDQESYEYEEAPEEQEYEYERNDYGVGSFGERLFELSQREFESAYELESELDQIVDDMHREFFFKSLFKKVKNSKFARGLISKGLKMAQPFASFIPGGSLALTGLQAATSLLGDNVKSRGRSLSRRAIDALRNRGYGLTRDLSSLGINPRFRARENQQGLENVAHTIQRAMEFAANNIHADIDDPIEADRLAGRAFEVALSETMSPANPSLQRPNGRSHQKGVRVINLREKPGEEIEKIVIVIRDKDRQ